MSNSISPFQNINERKHFIIDCYIEKNNLRNIYLNKFGGEKNEI